MASILPNPPDYYNDYDRQSQMFEQQRQRGLESLAQLQGAYGASSGYGLLAREAPRPYAGPPLVANPRSDLLCRKGWEYDIAQDRVVPVTFKAKLEEEVKKWCGGILELEAA